MAFIKLFPREGSDYLPVEEVIERLRSEFDYVEIDEEEGRDHVGGMIAATLRFSDELPWKQERLKTLQKLQRHSVYIFFGDHSEAIAAFCFMPDSEMFFGSPEEVDGAARIIVTRAAQVLKYELFEG